MGEFQYKDGFNIARVEPGLDVNGPTTKQIRREALFLEAVFEVEPKVLSSLEAILSAIPEDVKDRPIPPLITDRRLQGVVLEMELECHLVPRVCLQQLAVSQSLLCVANY